MPDLYRQIIDTLAACRRVLVTTHVRPDGDALGTAAAMVLALRQRDIASEVLLLSSLPSKYAFVFDEHDIKHHEWRPEMGGAFFDGFDAVLVLDTGTWSQLPGLREHLEAWPKPKLVIDHHLTQENWADVKLVIPDAAAAGEIAAELLEQWEIPFDTPLATCLFIAIASDTGWFQFANTRPYTLRLAAMLIEAGVDTDCMYQLLYQNERVQRLSLQARTLQSLQLLAQDRLAVMTIRQADFQQAQADASDVENLINVPLQVRTVEVSLLFVEPKDPAEPVRISLRSKGGVDVARFAEQFQGGGHARAAGLKLHGPIDQVQQRVVAAMLGMLSGDRSQI